MGMNDDALCTQRSNKLKFIDELFFVCVCACAYGWDRRRYQTGIPASKP